MDINDIVDAIDAAEYDELFPIEQEYNMWMNAIEADFQREADLRVAEADEELAL